MLRKMRQNGRMVVEAYSKDAEEEALVTGKTSEPSYIVNCFCCPFKWTVSTRYYLYFDDTERGTKAEGANIKTFADANPDAQMLCYQCEQTQNGTGCVTVRGGGYSFRYFFFYIIAFFHASDWILNQIKMVFTYQTGVCGKTPTVAQLQDLLIHHCKALGWFATEIRQIADVRGYSIFV